MATTLGAIILILLTSIGYGRLWTAANSFKASDFTSYELIMAGLGVLVTASVVLVIIGPLQNISSLALIAGGSLLGAHHVTNQLAGLTRDRGLVYTICLISVHLALLGYVAWPVSGQHTLGAYDTNLYHLQQVRWMREQGTPLGLANLHIRMGVQSTYLVIAALFEQGVLVARSAWFMPILFPCLGSWWCFATILRLLRAGTKTPLLFYCMVVQLVLFPHLLQISPRLYHDDVVGIMQIIIVGECLRLLELDVSNRPLIVRVKSLLLILTVFCLTIKLSSAATVLAVLFLGAVTHIRILPTRTSFVIVGCLLAAFLIRNFMLSGWVLFPAPVASIPVSWAVPTGYAASSNHNSSMQTVVGHYETIRAWARMPGPNYWLATTEGLSAWWSAWFSRFCKSSECRLLIYSYLMLITALCLIRSRRDLTYVSLVIILGFLPIGYWFLSAPDLRFGTFSFWILWGLIVGVLATRLNLPARPSFALILLWFAYSYSAAFKPVGLPNLIKSPQAQSLNVRTKVTKQGVVINVPATAGDDRCGNAPVPCTPYFQDHLAVKTRGERYIQFSIVSN